VPVFFFGGGAATLYFHISFFHLKLRFSSGVCFRRRISFMFVNDYLQFQFSRPKIKLSLRVSVFVRASPSCPSA